MRILRIYCDGLEIRRSQWQRMPNPCYTLPLFISRFPNVRYNRAT